MYQALYRKYRPQSFDDVVGQQTITRTLKAQLCSGKLSHAYLFTGSRGTGKTTCSKILAKAVNCLNPIDGNPCNCCEACRSIDSGACMDVLEIDAASNNGVDNVRTLREDAIYAPAQVKKRVYIIDEVHMLSISAFNALLKIIEEPPEHLLFILATTELHKVPATILSRCQRFSFRRITPEDIAGRLHYVAYEEGIDVTDDAVRLLSRLADGALRDGLSLLDQCAASVGGTLDAEAVYACLGLAGARKAAEMLRCVGQHDTGAALRLLDEQYAGGKDIAAMLDELVCLSRDLLILQTAPRAGGSMLTGICTEEEMQSLLPLFSPGELLRVTRLIQDTAAGFAKSANRRVDAELLLMELCEPRLRLNAEALNARLSRLEQRIASGQITVAAAAPAPAAIQSEQAEQPEEDQSATEQTAPEPAAGEELPLGFWTDLVAAVSPEIKPSALGFINVSSSQMVTPVLHGDQLELQAKTDLVKRTVDDEKTRELLAQKASAILGRPVRVYFSLGSGRSGEDPLQKLVKLQQEHPDIIHIREN